jgi:peptidyl-prolyl cis-trans isomerase C
MSRWRERIGLSTAVFPLALTTMAAAQVSMMPSHEPTAPAREAATVVARVNGVEIGSMELQAALDTRLPLSSYHRNVSPDKLAEMRREALDGLIDEELRYQEARRLGVRVAPKEIDQALERVRKAYSGGPQAFETARRASGATMQQLREGILRGLLIKKLYEQAITHSCVVAEREAVAYYEANRKRFILPEQIRPYVITIEVSPSAARPEWDRARQKANDLSRQIAAGTSFAALARQHSSDPSKEKGGDLGFVHRGRLHEEFEDALKTMRPGEVSGVIQSIYGFHLLRLAETRPAAQKSFAEVKEQLVRDLTDKRCSEAEAAWSKRLRAAAKIEIPGEKPQPTRTAIKAGH